MQRWETAALFLLCTAILPGCGQREEPYLYIYCNETFWYVMQEEALFFNRIYNFQIVLVPIRAERTSGKSDDTVTVGTDRHAPAPWRQIDVNQRSDDPFAQINSDVVEQLERISTESFGDMFLSDSQRHVEKLRKIAVSASEYAICYLTLTMLVPEGNPNQLHSVKEVLDSNRLLGIVDPSLDGLGESSWQMLGKIVPGGESAIPMDIVRLYERQYDLLEALEQGKIDAALVWNATSQTNYLMVKYADQYNAMYEQEMRIVERKKKREQLRLMLRAICEQIIEEHRFAEEVPLKQNPNERYIVSIRLVSLGSATDQGYCVRFADFMRSKQGKEVLQRFGFVTE